MRTQSHDSVIWDIVEVRPETATTKTLVLRAQSERPLFMHGQYLTVRLPGFEPAEGKSYSISSSPHEEMVSLTIKVIGAFSRAILALAPGDTLTTSLPYGFFYPEPPFERNLAFVAGGIGITPIMSLIESLTHDGFPKHMTLFYSNQTAGDITFRDRLDTLTSMNERISAHHFVTREQGDNGNIKYARMTAHDIRTMLPEPEATDIFICGTIDFTRSLWIALKNEGFPASSLYTEGFF